MALAAYPSPCPSCANDAVSLPPEFKGGSLRRWIPRRWHARPLVTLRPYPDWPCRHDFVTSCDPLAETWSQRIEHRVHRDPDGQVLLHYDVAIPRYPWLAWLPWSVTKRFYFTRLFWPQGDDEHRAQLVTRRSRLCVVSSSMPGKPIYGPTGTPGISTALSRGTRSWIYTTETSRARWAFARVLTPSQTLSVSLGVLARELDRDS